VDGLFFKPASYTKQVFGVSLGREDIYFACLTLFFAFLCIACALAMKIGASQKPNATRFFIFTAGNILLFSIWLWALSWMQISDAMNSPISKPLDLWRVGSLQVWVSTASFPTIIASAFILQAALLYFSFKKNFIAN